jgi:hypothetical protein
MVKRKMTNGDIQNSTQKNLKNKTKTKQTKNTKIKTGNSGAPEG